MDDLLLHGLKDIYYAENQSQRGEGRQKIVDGRVTQRGQPPGGALKHVRSIGAIGRRPLERLSADASARIVLNTVVLGNEIKAGTE